MRRKLMIPMFLLAGLLLAACGPGATPVIPTLAQLPTVTPLPPSVTSTPASTEAPPSTALDDSFVTPTSMEAEKNPTTPATASPTPDSLPATAPPAEPVACSAGALEAILQELDAEDLSAGQEGYMARLREAAGTAGGWTLVDEPDPLAGTTSADALPLGSLRFTREDQEALVLASAMIPEVLGYYRECIAEDAYIRQGDVSDTAEVTLETLDIGEQAVRVVVAEPALGEDGAPTGEMLTTTTLYLVLTQDALLQFLSIPALDAAMGRTPVTAGDAEALLTDLVGLVETLAAGD